MSDTSRRSSARTAAIDLAAMGRFAAMAGSSIAGPDAVAWVTHFLNAAFYRHPRPARDLGSLRIALAVLTTHWHRLGHRPLGARDVRRFHQSFRAGPVEGGSRYPRELLDRAQLEAGAAELLGPGFVSGVTDPMRTGWGIVFETPADRARYRPELRLAAARLGPLSPPKAAPAEQAWHTYEPVSVPGIGDVLAVLDATDGWSHFATDIGHFTALRSGPLAGQTFEVQVIAELARHAPMLTRGYVTVTRFLDRSEPNELRQQVAALSDNTSTLSMDANGVLPLRARPACLVELTTYAGHFLGRARNYLIVFETDVGAYIRTVGNWDPMPWYVRLSYSYAGADAQRAFWGFESTEESMLRQFARAAARRQPAREETPPLPMYTRARE